jgi:hypothetical protein
MEDTMAWDERYRMLKKGEIIQAGDEVDACADGWRDDPVWKPARCIGEPAPDPSYPSHRVYRRPNAAGQGREAYPAPAGCAGGAE